MRICFHRHLIVIALGWLTAMPPMQKSISAETNEPSSRDCLPEALASFGAVTHDGWIYVYSGHIGTAHQHSKDNLSQGFYRRRVTGGDWESLPIETPLQGLALVGYQGMVYRVGGMTAENSADQEPAMFSTDTFAKFNPATKQWTHLAPLPQGRSSHDAVVIGSKLYVVGGWQLAGDGEGDWHAEMLMFNFDQPSAGWRGVAQPFQRRALAVSHHSGLLYVIGGINAVGDIDRSVNVYDPATNQWSQGPEFPGEGMNGFGVSAWNNGQGMFASGSNGALYRLSDSGADWDEVAQLRTPRFFHQLVPAEKGVVLAVGGASRKGHLNEIESIQVGN